MENKDFFNTVEVCEFLGKTPQGLDHMCKAGKLQRHKRGIGNQNYYLKTEVEALLKYRKAA